jgi:hypothetical protein
LGSPCSRGSIVDNSGVKLRPRGLSEHTWIGDVLDARILAEVDSSSMRRLRHVASPDEVRITREPDGETALIEYAADDIGATHLKVGPALKDMTDSEVLDRFNQMIAAMEDFRREYKHVALEVPVGQPQIEWSELASQWSARGDVLRCVIHDGGGDDGREPVIEIDDKQLSWSEFGRMLTTFAGWGMRLVIVPDDETHEKPRIRVRDPSTVKSRKEL